MRPSESDRAHLWDMIDSARAVCGFIEGVGLDDYLKDRMRQRAVEREVEIIGEAARRVSDAFREAHPEIPWRVIIALRYVLAHEYGAIRQERMWALATVRMRELIAVLEPLVPPPPSQE